MIKILKGIYKILLCISRNLKYYYFPNILKILNGSIVLFGVPAVNQLIKFTGKGKVQIGKDCSFGCIFGGYHKYGYIELQARYPEAKIMFGNNIDTNNNLFICSANKIIIGDNTLIGQNVTIMDFEGHSISPISRKQIGKIGEVKIGNNVWIGNNVTILKNSTIGDNSIIAASAVVSSGVYPDNVIIGGVPAVIIKKID